MGQTGLSQFLMGHLQARYGKIFIVVRTVILIHLLSKKIKFMFTIFSKEKVILIFLLYKIYLEKVILIYLLYKKKKSLC